jgi:hypothetical protein
MAPIKPLDRTSEITPVPEDATALHNYADTFRELMVTNSGLKAQIPRTQALSENGLITPTPNPLRNETEGFAKKHLEELKDLSQKNLKTQDKITRENLNKAMEELGESSLASLRKSLLTLPKRY